MTKLHIFCPPHHAVKLPLWRHTLEAQTMRNEKTMTQTMRNVRSTKHDSKVWRH